MSRDRCCNMRKGSPVRRSRESRGQIAKCSYVLNGRIEKGQTIEKSG